MLKQKQSLNEVENLYFTHSTIRGSRPQNNSSTLLPVTVRDLQPKSAQDSSLSFSFKTGGLAKRDSLAMSVDQDSPSTLPILQPSPELIPSTPSTANVSINQMCEQSIQPTQTVTGIPFVANIPTATPNLSPAPSSSTSPNASKKTADLEDPYGFKSSNTSLTYDSFWATTSSKASSSFKGKAAAA